MQGPFRAVLPLVLASASPRRQALLAGQGLCFAVQPSSCPEPAPEPHEEPAAYAARMASLKGQERAWPILMLWSSVRIRLWFWVLQFWASRAAQSRPWRCCAPWQVHGMKLSQAFVCCIKSAANMSAALSPRGYTCLSHQRKYCGPMLPQANPWTRQGPMAFRVAARFW